MMTAKIKMVRSVSSYRTEPREGRDLDFERFPGKCGPRVEDRRRPMRDEKVGAEP